MHKLAASLLLLAMPVASTPARDDKPDPWANMRFLVGEWAGTASGEPGTGTASRRYEFILGGRFLYERNTSTYPPQEKNRAGEVHQHWSIFSFDRNRNTLVFRQFHQEGFVVVYVLNPGLSTSSKLVFDSERIENFNSS